MIRHLTRQQIIAYSAISVLLLALFGVLLYSQLFVGSGSSPALEEEDVAEVGGLRAEDASEAFNVEILKHPQYTSLNRSLLDGGRLPVSPPTSRGKPNPFGL